MLDFDTYAMRHGESFLLQLIEGTERHLGIRTKAEMSLEERWDFVMNDLWITSSQQMAA